ncbi:MAG: VIT domain-containing protein [Pseudomonadota bacterium]
MFKRCLAFLAACVLAGATHATVRTPLIVTQPGAQPITLQQLDIRADISGGMAGTTVRMVFFNPNHRPLEGNLQFPLAEGQQVTGFALDIDGAMRPAVPVEKKRGREIFDAIERRNVDPALLEKTQGNNFKLRIFPIGAGATRTVELTVSETLARHGAQWRYRLPLDYGQVAHFNLDIVANGAPAEPLANDMAFSGGAAHMARDNFFAEGVREVFIDVASTPQVVRDGNWFVAEVPVSTQTSARPRPRTVGLLWDSSGSGAARRIDAELAELDHYFAALGEVEVRLQRLRDRAETEQRFQVHHGDWSALRQALASTVYDGATAINDWQVQADVDVYLLFSDGLSNYGYAHVPELGPRQRLFSLNSAASANTERLAAIAERSGGSLIDIQAGAAQALLQRPVSIEQLSADGATDLEVEARAARHGLLRVAGRMTSTSATLTLRTSDGKTVTVAIPADAPHHPQAGATWAGYRIRALSADLEAHQAEIGRLGRQFGLVTATTSLIVLDRLEDYLLYGLTPPDKYASQFNKMKQGRMLEQAQRRRDHFADVLRQWEQRISWWNASYAGLPPKGIEAPAPRMMMMAESAAPAAMMARSAPPPLDARMAKDGSAPKAAQIGISLKKWVPNAPYIERLRASAPGKVYAAYLDERPGYANSSAFYLDVADILFDKGQRDLALRVLSNLAEMDLENRALLRILAYRLLQAGAPQLAIPILEQVLQLAQEEPQSYRDLGLAYAAAGQYQQALERLYDVAERPWDGRFPDIEAIALTEMNAIIAKAPKGLDLRRVDPRLLKNMPLDVRVAMTWDADNADMDLWVTDAYGEKCFYAHPLTAMGGRMSRDFTGGYGPEEFSLRRARPGKYRIEANYYGNRQQVLAGATTLQVKLFTGYGTPRQKEQTIALRLKERGESVYVGEFDVKP